MIEYLRQVHTSVNRGHVVGRRDFLKGISLASLAAGALTWTDLMSLRAGELRRRGQACILLWMAGGPSQFETFDPKPGHANGGETKAIDTNASGVRISANFPELAQVMDRVAIVRSMTSKEGNHQRASQLLHTGYTPTASVKYPTLGSIVAQQLPNPQCDLPAFVRIGSGRGNSGGAGMLGVDFDPFSMAKAEKFPDNGRPTTSADRYQRRLGLLSRLESDYASAGGAALVADHQKLYGKAARMIMSSEMDAFDLTKEPQAMHAAYGDSEFAAGCLLARRLIETGVTFVEVQLGGWDTHDNNFERSHDLAAQVDRPFSEQLIRDLGERGLLDSTLVVWMGEFGRTPRINGRGGRDHYPKSFNVALAGGGVRGGQVIGRTDDSGAEVADGPVTVPDLFQTFCKSLKIDATIENMSPIGRPIKIVDGGQPVSELFA